MQLKQKDWKESGEYTFVFEILEELEKRGNTDIEKLLSKCMTD